MKTIEPNSVSTAILQGFLQSAIGPRPIAFASTMDKDGNPNLSPFSFFNIFSANPPILVFSPARRVRDNSIKHTLENVYDLPEVVINVVNFNMVQQTSLSSTEYPKGINEFEKSGFTPLKSDIVKPFRVKESPVQFECKVNNIVPLGTEGGAGNLVICEILKMHISEDVLDDNGNIDQFKLDLVSRLGANWYSRANMGLFEVEKPLTTLGIGVDLIPDWIKQNPVFDGNDFGKLGNIESLPIENEIRTFAQNNEKIHQAIKSDDNQLFCNIAKEYLDNNQVENAWKTLLLIKNI